MNELLWYTSRATGIVSVVLMTIVFVLGILTAGGRWPRGDGATVIMGMHRWLSLGMLVFLGGHIGTAITESYVKIDWISAVVPFTSDFSPGFVGLGTLAFDLLLAVGVTSMLRHRLSDRAWKRVHWLSYLMWPIAILHGIALGTTDQPWLRLTTLACGVIGTGAVLWRQTHRDAHAARRRQIASQEWS